MKGSQLLPSLSEEIKGITQSQYYTVLQILPSPYEEITITTKYP